MSQQLIVCKCHLLQFSKEKHNFKLYPLYHLTFFHILNKKVPYITDKNTFKLNSMLHNAV